jgi:preprotein translocase subunit SecA
MTSCAQKTLAFRDRLSKATRGALLPEAFAVVRRLEANHEDAPFGVSDTGGMSLHHGRISRNAGTEETY